MADADGGIAGLKVLVVDDTATNRQMLQIFLKKLGCEPLLAEDGVSAITIFEREAPDVVLMDVMMPVMDGYEAARRIKARCADRWVPVVFISALDKSENLVAGLEAGGDDYLPKPVDFTVLTAKLRSLARTLTMQHSLDENRRRTEAITDNITDCVITISGEGIIQSVNTAVTTLFGYRAEELLGRNVSMLMPEPHRSAHDGYLSRYVHGGVPTVIGVPHREVTARTKDGTLIPMELTATEMRFNGKRLFVGVMHDIRARLAAEQAAREHAATLQRYHDDKEAETQLASAVMLRVMQRKTLADPSLHHWMMPATDFSGDIIAVARTSDGRLCALLADATGHGLAAAISVLPVLTSFYSLVENDFPLGYIAYEINRQLLAFMPVGRFVAASLISFDEKRQAADLWMGGMPDLLLLGPDGTVLHRAVSSTLPLGIVEFDEDMAEIAKIACPAGSQWVLASDGLLEAQNDAGEAFGAERLLGALAGASRERRLDAVRAAFRQHMGGAAPQDDVSVLMIDC